MATVKVVDKTGKETGSIELSDELFNIKPNEELVHQAVVQYLANQRQGTKSTKTRAEVRGGGKKPWKQKGTGRARHGSIRSPIWVGGGVAFAPKPRDYSFKLNRKAKRLALKSVLSSKVQKDNFIVVEDLNLSEIKTKEMVQILKNLDAKNALVILDSEDRNAILSLRNIPKTKSASVNTINVYDILLFDKIVVTKECVEKMQEVYA